MESKYITDDDLDGLKKYAEYQSAFKVPTASKIGSIIFGIIALFAGLGSISSNALNVILVGIGVALLAEGVWLIISPSYLGLLVDAITIACIGVWNIVISFVNAQITGSAVTPWSIYGIFQLIWGITTIIRFRKYSESIETLSRDQIDYFKNIADSLYDLSPNDYPDMFSFKSGKFWKGIFNGDNIICVANNGNDVMASQRNNFYVIVNREKSHKGQNKVTVLFNQRRFKGTIDDISLQNYETWVAEGTDELSIDKPTNLPPVDIGDGNSRLHSISDIKYPNNESLSALLNNPQPDIHSHSPKRRSPILLILVAVLAGIILIIMGAVILLRNPLVSISVTPGSQPNLVKGLTESFTATGIYKRGPAKDVTADVKWTSADNSIAIIDSDGVATAISAGNDIIMASWSGRTSQPISLTVIALYSISITPISLTNLTVGSVQQFMATGTYSDGSKVDITSQANWTSSDSSVAIVSSSGLVTSIEEGNTYITASLFGVTSASINIKTLSVLDSVQIYLDAGYTIPWDSNNIPDLNNILNYDGQGTLVAYLKNVGTRDVTVSASASPQTIFPILQTFGFSVSSPTIDLSPGASKSIAISIDEYVFYTPNASNETTIYFNITPAGQ